MKNKDQDLYVKILPYQSLPYKKQTIKFLKLHIEKRVEECKYD